MRHILIITLITLLSFLGLPLQLNAQTSATESSERKNSLNVYIGIFDLNLNYERDISQKPKSISKLRFGFGYAMFPNAGEGYYINGAFVQLFGAKNSHLEIDAGLKYMLTNSISDPELADQLLPDIFVGYRFERPTGGLIFRAGLNYPTVVNLGIGYNF